MDSTEGEIDLNLTAVDIGYNTCKALAANGQVGFFPSVVGTPTRETFSIEQAKKAKMVIALPDSTSWPVGETALKQSAYTTGRRDAGWVLETSWRILLYAALSELHKASIATRIITGLPLEDYKTWADRLRKALIGEHTFKRNGSNWQTIKIEDAFIITQPYGSLLDQAMTDTGKILSNAFSTGMVGVVDIGGNTLNLLVAHELEEIGQWTHGDGLGLLKALDAIARDIHAQCPGIQPKAPEVAQWLAVGTFPYQGHLVGIASIAQPHLDPLVTMILNRLSEVWQEPGRFSATLLTGGGSLALGRALKAKMDGIYPEVLIAKDAQFANVRGYLKLARDMWG